ncbi:glycosyltransferase [Streptomyces sp. NPDC029674]|uniref:glycosyltransferase n=1 Tax=Streptomyces sp. NPDC029674 TaxID=3365297 RepID=UPI00384E3907
MARKPGASIASRQEKHCRPRPPHPSRPLNPLLIRNGKVCPCPVSRSSALRTTGVLRSADRHGHPSGPGNLALARARGEYVAYLDHDDRWLPEHLAVPLTAFDQGAEAVATGNVTVDRNGLRTAASTPLDMCWHPEFQLMVPLFEPSRVAHRRGLDDTGTRRHCTARPHRLPLVVLDDPRAARRLLQSLHDPARDAELRAACARDLRAWFQRTCATAQFVRPNGWQGDFLPGIDRMVHGLEPLWPDLVVVPHQGGGYALSQRLWCTIRGHAMHIRALAYKVYREQLALLPAWGSRGGS